MTIDTSNNAAPSKLFPATTWNDRPPKLEDLMEEFKLQWIFDSTAMLVVNHAIDYFKSKMNQVCLWQDSKYVLNSALIKRYLIEIFGFNNLPIETLLEELTAKGAIPHNARLIDAMDSAALNQTLVATAGSLSFLKNIIANQPPDIANRLIKKICPKTLQTLIDQAHTTNQPTQIELLKTALATHSVELCITLLEKLNGIPVNIREPWAVFSEKLKAASKRTFFLRFYYSVSFLLERNKHSVFLGLVLLGLGLSIPLLLLYALIISTFDAIRGLWSSIIDTYQELYLSPYQRLFNHPILTFQSDQSAELLAVFFYHLSPQLLEKLYFPFELAAAQHHLPKLLFASDLPVNSADVFYDYWQSNAILKKILIHNEYDLLTRCIDSYFEGKLNKPHAKMVTLLITCLLHREKKQGLSEKEQAFLEETRKETLFFTCKTPEEIWLSGVDSWSYYRYLRIHGDPVMQDTLDVLSSKNELFGGPWAHQLVSESLNSDIALRRKDKEAFKLAKACIETDQGLVKTIKPAYWDLFMKTLNDPNYRAALRKKPITTNATKKYIHLNGKIVDYEFKRRTKLEHKDTKKTSCTLLSRSFITPLYHPDIGLLFDRRQCVVKAMLVGTDANTYNRGWIGDEQSVTNYKKSVAYRNVTNEEQFIAQVQHHRTMTNEVLAKINSTALRAILIQVDNPEARREAIKCQEEIEVKFSKRLPILLYRYSHGEIQHCIENEHAVKHTVGNQLYRL